MFIQELGLGLAVAVLLDATIIRSVLLPATMTLLGDWNWWLPRFLRWLPRVTIEGDPDEPEELDWSDRGGGDWLTRALSPSSSDLARPTDEGLRSQRGHKSRRGGVMVDPADLAA